MASDSKANGATVQGTIVGVNDTFNLNNVNIEGRLIGGASGQNFVLGSNFSLEQPTTTAVPEPASSAIILLSLSSLGIVSGVRRLYRRRSSAK